MKGIQSILGQPVTSAMSRLNAEIPKPTQEENLKPPKTTHEKTKIKSTIKTSSTLSTSPANSDSLQNSDVQTSIGQQQPPSGKPPIIARFRGVTYNEESSDEESSSGDVSSDSDSESGSDDESEGEGEDDEEEDEDVGDGEESSITDSGSESEGSDDEDEEDDDENNSSLLVPGSDLSFSDGTSPAKRKAEESQGIVIIVIFNYYC